MNTSQIWIFSTDVRAGRAGHFFSKICYTTD